MSARQAYEARLGLIGEQRTLREESTDIGARLGDMRREKNEAALQLGAIQNRTRGDLSNQELQAAQRRADQADRDWLDAEARREQISIRLAEIENEVHQPLALAPKDIAGHLKALGLARQAVAKLEDAATNQAELVSALSSGPDARAEHAARRAELSAKVLLGEAATADLERLDAEAEPALKNADAQASRLEEATAVATVLAARLVAAQRQVDDLHPLSKLCAASVASSELAAVSQEWQAAAEKELELRNRVAGLDQLLRAHGGNPPPRPVFEALTISEAARLELERLRAEHRDLF